MNSRIKDLVEQAELEFDDDLSLEPEPIYYTTQKDLEKFAQLIIEECRSIIDDVYQMTSLEMCGPLLTTDEEILSHFYGVEE